MRAATAVDYHMLTSTPMHQHADDAPAATPTHRPTTRPLISPSTAASTSAHLPSSPSSRHPARHLPSDAEPFQPDLLPHGRQRLAARQDAQRVTSQAVKVPDPKRGYAHSINTEPGRKMGKPTSGGIKPMNTLDGPGTTQSTNKKPKTYGRGYPTSSSSSSSTFPTLNGAETYRRLKSVRSLGRALPDEESIRSSGDPSPAKRRRISRPDNSAPTKSRSGAVIEIDDDDDNDVREVSSRSTNASVYPSLDSASTTSTPRSNGSWNTASGCRSRAQSTSEFENVEQIAQSHRKKSRKSTVNTESTTHHCTLPATGCVSQEVPASIFIDDDDSSVEPKSARKHILSDFQQGYSTNSKNHVGVVRDTGPVESHHFPNARVNESTSEICIQTAQRRVQKETPTCQNLREHRRVQASSELEQDQISYSSDELARSSVHVRPSKHSGERAKPTQTANSGAKRKATGSHLSAYSLARVRSSNADWVEATPEMQLLLNCDARPWEIVECSTGQKIALRMAIDPKHVVKAQADSSSRVRLEGSRPNTGCTPIWDFEFLESGNLTNFIERHAKPVTAPSHVSMKEEGTMEKLFNLQLPQSRRPATSPTAENFAVGNGHVRQQQVNKVQLLGKAGTSIEASSALEMAGLNADALPPKHTSTRPIRSTRNSGQGYHEKHVDLEPAHTKHSVEVGLGPQWDKPLQFGTGRRRAVVHFDDLPRLDEDELLNDSLIDFYIIYLFDKFKVPAEKVFFFNTYFYTALTKNAGRNGINYDAVKRWTAKDDIFSHDYIVVPINEDTHWYLAIICNVANIARKPIVDDFSDPQTMPSSMTLEGEVGESVEPAAAESATADPLSYELDDGTKTLDEGAEEDGDINLIDPDDASTAGKTPVISAQTPSIIDQLEEAITPAEDDVAGSDAPMRAFASNLRVPTRKKVKRKPALPKRDPTNPVIVILDSLGSTRTNAVRALKSWLKAEGMEKRGMEVEIKEKGLYPKSTQIPMQDNFSDCGVFVLGYATKFLQDPDAFRSKILTGEMSAHTDWPDMKPSVIRTDLRNILFDLQKKQADTRRAEHKAKKEMRNRPPLAPATSQPAIPRPLEPTQEKIGSHDTTAAKAFQVDHDAPPKLRLGSPFRHEPQCAPSRIRSPPAQQVLKVSDSPPAPVNGKPPVALPGKRNSPVVLIPLDQKARDDHDKHTASGGHSGAPHGTSEGDSDHPIPIEESQESLASTKPVFTRQMLNEDPESDPMDIDHQPELESVQSLAMDMDMDIDAPAHVQQTSQISEYSGIGETPTPQRSSPVPDFTSAS